nr:uncharacterized protein LOC123572751 isoform X1 [Macaca fascicularis]XP_045245858.1 uncharacterized protein LOC123572751 isoform X1 [Macaca fascicularis]
MEGAYEMCRAVCYVSANSRRKHGHGNTWSLHRKTRVMEAAELLSRPGVSRGTAECLGSNLIVFPRPRNPGLTGPGTGLRAAPAPGPSVLLKLETDRSHWKTDRAADLSPKPRWNVKYELFTHLLFPWTKKNRESWAQSYN